MIQQNLKQPLKHLGTVTAFNGMDVQQTKHYIKILCHTYLKKILIGHNWDKAKTLKTIKTPMNTDKQYIDCLETSTRPTDVKEHNQLEQQMGFKYRQAIGELLFAAVTCQPDIMYSIIKLSLFSDRPHKSTITLSKMYFDIFAQHSMMVLCSSTLNQETTFLLLHHQNCHMTTTKVEPLITELICLLHTQIPTG